MLFGDYQHTTTVFNYLNGTHREARFFSEVHGGRTRGKRLKLQEGKFQLDIRKEV